MHSDGSGNSVEDGQLLYLKATSQCKPPCHQAREQVALSRMGMTPEMEIHKKNEMNPVGAMVAADERRRLVYELLMSLRNDVYTSSPL